MQNTLYIIIYIVSIGIAYLIGRSYVVIKRSKMPQDATDIVSDVSLASKNSYEKVKETLKPPRTRVISPSKRATNSLKDLENDGI